MNKLYLHFTKQNDERFVLCSGFWNIDTRKLNKDNVEKFIDNMFVWNDADIDKTYICEKFTTVNPRWKKFGYLK